MAAEYITEVGLPGARLLSVPDVPTAAEGEDGDEAWSQNGTRYTKASGVWSSAQGGAAAGSPVVRAFDFAHDTPGLLTGHPVYTPTIGDILLDAWFEIETVWNGTTPMGDVGPFPTPLVTGLFASVIGAVGGAVGAIDFTQGPAGFYTAMAAGAGISRLSDVAAVLAVADLLGVGQINSVPTSGTQYLVPFSYPPAPSLGNGDRFLPARFTTAEPIKVVVSQDGTITGADPGSTQGAATLYLVTCTPLRA